MIEPKYGKVRRLSDGEKMSIVMDLKERGIIDDITFRPGKLPLVNKVTPRKKKKKNFKPYYHQRDYESNFYSYMKKQNGF